MTTELNSVMEALESNPDAAETGYKWQVNDNCVLKYGSNWARSIIEEITFDTARCKVCIVSSLCVLLAKL